MSIGVGKNHRVKERQKEGRLQEPVCSLGGAADSAPRTAPVFVLVQTPAPALSPTATAGAPVAFSTKPASERESAHSRKRESERERDLPILSPHPPNSALTSSHHIAAADFNLASPGIPLPSTWCWGLGCRRGQCRLNLKFVSLPLSEAPASHICPQTRPTLQPKKIKKERKKKKSGSVDQFAGAHPGLWTHKDAQTS